MAQHSRHCASTRMSAGRARGSFAPVPATPGGGHQAAGPPLLRPPAPVARTRPPRLSHPAADRWRGASAPAPRLRWRQPACARACAPRARRGQPGCAGRGSGPPPSSNRRPSRGALRRDPAPGLGPGTPAAAAQPDPRDLRSDRAARLRAHHASGRQPGSPVPPQAPGARRCGAAQVTTSSSVTTASSLWSVSSDGSAGASCAA